jgi:pimeloyl-ACP methyl ester carboxylesterase
MSSDHERAAVTQPSIDVVEVLGQRLTTATWPGATGMGPDIILLHDGLGSIAQWRSVPAGLAVATGRTVLAYDRAGHGESTPSPTGPWPPDWLHREAEVLAALITAVGASAPALVGHSDGGSIAAIHAGTAPTACGAVALLAAHTWVETVTVDEIARMRAAPDRIVTGLQRFHARPAELFEAWSGVWVSDGFAHWDIRPRLHAITAPVLVVQGAADEYATDAHATETSAAIGDNAQCRLLPGLGHVLHHEAPDEVTDLVAAFLAPGR